MMISWMLHALLVGALVAGAACGLEGLLRLYGLPVRGVWAAALAATLLLVAAAPLRDGYRELSLVVSEAAEPPVAASAARDGSTRSPRWVVRALEWVQDGVSAPLAWTARQVRRVAGDGSDRVLGGVWLGLSGVLLLTTALTLQRYRAARRRWPLALLHGERVRISPDAGPAVMGLLRPELVVPRWLLGSPEAEQRLVLAHEREHLRARDPLLLAAGSLAAVLLAWHPAVWWMLSRLRLAVELDCDARVLRRGVEPRSYGFLLIDLAGRCGGLRIGASAIADTPSHLERRLLAMRHSHPRFALVRAAAFGTLALTALLVACEARLPTTAEVEEMDAAAAVAAAQRLSLLALGEGMHAVYFIDGSQATEGEAQALRPDEIGQIAVRRTNSGEPAEIRIRTRDALLRDGEQSLVPEGALRFEDPALAPTGALLYERKLENHGEEGPIRLRVLGESPTAGGEKFGGVILIDGVRANEAAMRALRPAEIESVKVLKGSAASELYGPEAANGVVLITTRKTAGR